MKTWWRHFQEEEGQDLQETGGWPVIVLLGVQELQEGGRRPLLPQEEGTVGFASTHTRRPKDRNERGDHPLEGCFVSMVVGIEGIDDDVGFAGIEVFSLPVWADPIRRGVCWRR